MAGGNYGGSSIPLQSIDGATLWAAKATTYKDWMCASFVGNRNNTFSLSRNNLSVDIPYEDGVQQDMLISPIDFTADPTVNVIFNCYECSCDDAMTGTTKFNETGYAYPPANDGTRLNNESTLTKLKTYGAFAPTIIGGGGLNN